MMATGTCLAPCSYNSEENKCHRTQFCRKEGLLRTTDLDDEARELLLLRTGMPVNMDTGTLCLHHEQVYIYKYAFQQKSCCDPRKVHKRSISKHLKILTIQDSKELNSIKHVFVKPGQKLCYNCLKMLKAAESESQTCMSEIESDTSDIDFTPQGCRGTHSVCVCTIHQNVKLMISALPSETAVTYHDLMAKLVCSVDSNLCMIHRCPECPGADELRSHLETLCGVSDRLAPDETIQYKQWLTTDRTTLQTLSMPLQEFIDTIVEKTDKLTSHHYIAKHQAAYLSSLKENLGPDEAIIILDFAENYSFVVQDAAQGFHWDNSQATLHPFVAYFNKDGQTHESMCVVSDCLQHNTITVHRFLYDVLHHMKEICPGIKKIYYFSDGAASQYKNYKNLCNLTYHLDDFGLHAEWHFFATSHGKNACDGVGGTVKREAAKASLQATLVGHILTPKDLYDWAQAHISKVKFFFIDKEDVTGHADQQNTRFASSKAVPGTRSHHCYIPDLEGNKLLVRRVSGDAVSFEVSNVRARDEPVVNVPDEVSSPELQKTSVSLKQCEIGKYVCCLYDGKWWIGLIRDKSEEDEDVQISFMHPHGPARSFQWPRREDLCYVPLMCILCLINAPSTPNGRQYHLDKADKDNVMKLV